MSTFDWERFLRRWNQAVLESMDDLEKQQLPPEVLESNWLGYPGATEDQIVRTETRLEVKLPPSYRDFLKVTNGWRQTAKQTAGFNHRFWSTEQIEWFGVRHPRWIKAFSERHDAAGSSLDDSRELDDQWEPIGISDEDYFVYGENQDPSTIRPEYLKTALEISDVGLDSIYLLNPQVVTPDGEWEAWFFADYLPGADRYRSFQEMMEAEYRNFLEFRESEAEVREAVTTSDAQSIFEPVISDEADLSLDCRSINSPAKQGNSVSEFMTDSEPIIWQSLKRLTVEFQYRQVNDQAEYRTLVSAGGVSQPQVWSGLMEHKLRLWLRQHLAEAKSVHLYESGIASDYASVANATAEITLVQSRSNNTMSMETPPKKPASPPVREIEVTQEQKPSLEINLEIAQLAIRQPSNPTAQIVLCPAMARQKQKFGIGSLYSQRPFSIEVEFYVAGQPAGSIALQDILYKAQVFAQNRMTHQWIELGETPPNALENARSTYTATLQDQVLEPGMYRMQVLTSLSGATMALASFEMPLLNVV